MGDEALDQILDARSAVPLRNASTLRRLPAASRNGGGLRVGPGDSAAVIPSALHCGESELSGRQLGRGAAGGLKRALPALWGAEQREREGLFEFGGAPQIVGGLLDAAQAR